MKKAILHELLVEMIQDLYDAERQLIDALPMMAEGASEADLQKGFEEHLAQTEEHVSRLEEVAEALECEVEGTSCMGMEGLLSEGQEILEKDVDMRVRDLGLIAAAQKVEHYEIAGYGSAVELAKAMGHTDVADLLHKTLEEEKKTDQLLTKAAEKIIRSVED